MPIGGEDAFLDLNYGSSACPRQKTAFEVSLECIAVI